MNLDEAIEHAQYVSIHSECAECRKEHLQLMIWLSELKARRESFAAEMSEYGKLEAKHLILVAQIEWLYIVSSRPDSNMSGLQTAILEVLNNCKET